MFNRKLSILAMFFLASVILAGQLWASDSKSGMLEKKTLTRTTDVVLTFGRVLKNNLGRDIKEIGIFAFLDGKMVPIPFQIDEINKEGEWVLTQIPASLAKSDLKPERDEDDGSLDENDELSFMVRDTGDRVAPDLYPPQAVKVDEIMINDPLNGGKAWAYLCSFNGPFDRSHRDYVKYVEPGDRIKTDNYEMEPRLELPIAPGLISIHGSPNILDRMKIRLKTKVLGLKFSIDETRFISKLSLYQDGPIRVVRRTKSAIKFVGIFRTPSAAVENIYYENASVIPIRVALPMSVKTFKSLIGYIKVRGTADFQNMHGWKLKTDADPGRWFNIDGKMDEAEKTLDGKDVNWFLASGPTGAFMIRLITNRMPDGSPQKSPLKARLFYVDDDLSRDPPEFVPGQSPDAGFWIDGIEDMEKGTLYFFAIFYLIKDYRDGTEIDYLNILDKPLEVKVN